MMPAQCHLVNPIEEKCRWDSLIVHFPDASFFHSSAWAAALIKSYSFKPFYCVWIDNDKPCAIIPILQTKTLLGKRRGVSIAFSDSCEPLYNNPEEFRRAFEGLVEIGRDNKWDSIEIRGGAKVLGAEPYFQKIYTHDINLGLAEKEIFESFRDSTKRNIRNAKKQDVEISHSTTVEALREFYRLNCLTRRGHGIPPQPWKFFCNLQANAFQHDKGFVTLASHKGVVIAANLYLLHGTKAIYKYGASDRKYQHVRPSNIVMWEGIRKCRERGCTTLNLGRTEFHHEGLLQFKRGFGSKETTINYYRYDLSNNRFVSCSAENRMMGLASRVMSRLPIPLLKLAGLVLYKYVG
jgi:hypothetical protein